MYDVIIIGAGPAGLTSAIYSRRADKKTLVLEAKAYGGQIINTLDIENYPVEAHISGFDFATKLFNQAKELGAENRKLDIEREQELIGKGILYCATCDGAFYKEKTVAVVGGGNTAIEDALYLTDIAKEVYIIHRRDE